LSRGNTFETKPKPNNTFKHPYVWYLNKKITFDTPSFQKKCKYKKVEPNIEELIKNKTPFGENYVDLPTILAEVPRFFH